MRQSSPSPSPSLEEATHGLLNHNEPKHSRSGHQEVCSRTKTNVYYLFQIAVVFSVAFALGFYFGQVKTAQAKLEDGFLLPPGIIQMAFDHNLTFSQRPTPDWERGLGGPIALLGQDEFLNSTGTRMAPSHIRHCFDYLRQTIMCAADTNLEVLDWEMHLTSGWGQNRICRDFEKVFEWAEKWANSSDTGLIT
ncbi:hypothetical protein BDV06DRAFT_211161 [Aspergillus oleicola]